MKKIQFFIPLLLFFSSCAQPTPAANSDLLISPPKTGFAPLRGISLYYEIYGSGAPLVLIHGGGSTIESNFSQMIPKLEKNRQLIAIEEPGHGHTPAVPRAFTFENTADDVAALLDYLKIDRADIFGFSNGGTTALLVAHRHPEKVRKLIVASANYRRDGMVKGFWDSMKNASLANMPKALQEADQKINPDPKHLEQLFLEDSNRMKNFKDIPEVEIHSITAPTLVIVGDNDVVTVDHALRMSRLLPHGDLVVLPSQHGSYLGEVASSPRTGNRLPEATAILIEDFLEK